MFKVIMCFLLFGTISSYAQKPRYEIVDFPFTKESHFVLMPQNFSINNKGDVSGFYRSEDDLYQLFIWNSTKALQVIDMPGVPNQLKINDQGQLGGDFFEEGDYTTFFWNKNKGFTFIEHMKFFDMNNNGQIVGIKDNRPCLWHANNITFLDGLKNVISINNQGIIAGSDNEMPLVWKNRKVQPLAPHDNLRGYTLITANKEGMYLLSKNMSSHPWYYVDDYYLYDANTKKLIGFSHSKERGPFFTIANSKKILDNCSGKIYPSYLVESDKEIDLPESIDLSSTNIDRFIKFTDMNDLGWVLALAYTKGEGFYQQLVLIKPLK